MNKLFTPPSTRWLAKITLVLIIASIAGCNTLSAKPKQAEAATNFPASESVMAQMEKVANWQIPRLDKLDYIDFKRSESERPKRWIQGAFMTGLTEIAERSTNPFYEKYIGWRGGEQGWELGYRPDFGDDQLIGQTWIWHYKRNGGDQKIEPTRTVFDAILANPPTNDLTFTNGQDSRKMHTCQLRWCWADALFMAPPVWFALSDATGDPRYFNYANQEFKATVEHLYDEDLHLMYRDSRFIGKKGDFGEQIFWARGTGWVYAGLVRSLEYIPLDHPDRPYYEKLFIEMSAKLKSLQKKDGSWAMSLLAQEKIKEPETSGTAFFVYGLAWGIKNGLLDERDYRSSTLSGWNALTSAIHADGKLGWVQRVGAAPGQVAFEDSQLYAVGGFLLAGSMIYDIAQSKERAMNKNVRATYGRYVPERLDDFAWENDKVAFRIYGPTGDAAGPASGVDAWLKRVPYPIIDKWYNDYVTQGISYHEDHGEGYDPYHTGSTRGVGGTAVWVGAKAYPAGKYNDARVLSNDGQTITFKVRHHDWQTPLGRMSEEKIITLSLGSQLYHAKSTFRLNSKPAIGLSVAVGLATHEGKARVYQNRDTGRISTWETIDEYGLGTGALMNPSLVENIVHVPSKEKDTSHVWLLTKTDATGSIEYKAGFGWEAAGEIKDVNIWNTYLDTYTKK